MEILIILINFIAMLLALVWSSRAEAQGEKATASGIFAYRDFPEMRVKPGPSSRGPRR